MQFGELAIGDWFYYVKDNKNYEVFMKIDNADNPSRNALILYSLNVNAIGRDFHCQNDSEVQFCTSFYTPMLGKDIVTYHDCCDIPKGDYVLIVWAGMGDYTDKYYCLKSSGRDVLYIVARDSCDIGWTVGKGINCDFLNEIHSCFSVESLLSTKLICEEMDENLEC